MRNATPNRLRAAALAFGLLLGGAASLAAGDSRWHVEGTIGPASLDTTLGRRWPKSFDGDDESASLEVGYSLTRFLGLQAGIHDLGTYEGFGSPCPESAENCIESLAQRGLDLCIEGHECALVAVPLAAEVSGLSLALLPRWPVNDRFAVYGKLGVMDWDADVTARQGGLGHARLDRFSDRDLLTGLGVRYRFRSGFELVAEHLRFDLDLASTRVGAGWRF